MTEWIEILSKNGLAVLVLFALAWFLYKKIWPLIEKRLADADTREKENLQRWEDQGKSFTDALRQEREYNARRFEDQGKLFTDALRTQNILASETHKEITQELRAINQLLRNGK